ncbi:MAG: ribosome-binding factor A [Bacteroidetes bacterium GWF2_49_14]|nr:MAG: ribosome-binding factor A [Bacteroidetes bacterium GWF2_49_14]HBB93710.1 30S ribosome-binding factor RbfA [Bacteroidales bacterium]
MDSTRMLKISRLIQKELAEYFRENGKELGQGSLISVTAVRISPDLGQARVYLSIFPSAKAEPVVKDLESHVKTIRFELGKKIAKQVRHIPELRFYIDDSMDYAERIDVLLKQ